jgi:hypothetical protein
MAASCTNKKEVAWDAPAAAKRARHAVAEALYSEPQTTYRSTAESGA